MKNSVDILQNRYRVLLLLFLAAAVTYAIGFSVGFWVLIALGAAFELAFWFELFFGRRRRKSPEKR